MRTVLYLIFLVMLALAMIIATIGLSAKAGGPWSDQYCDISTETIIVKDLQGNIVSKNTKETVKCEDGVMDFLHGAKIAKNCKFFTWDMPLGETVVKQRSISCKKLDGGYEIVPGYHSVE